MPDDDDTSMRVISDAADCIGFAFMREVELLNSLAKMDITQLHSMGLF